MKFYVALSVAALTALGACQTDIGEKTAEETSMMDFSAMSCDELGALKTEYEKAGEMLSTNDDVNAAAAVVGVAGAVAGSPVAGAVAANAIGEDMQEQDVREAGEARLTAVIEAGALKGCW